MAVKKKRSVVKRKPYGGKQFLPEYFPNLQVMCSWDDKEYDDELWIIPASFFKGERDGELVRYWFFTGGKESGKWRKKANKWNAVLKVSGNSVILDDTSDVCKKLNRRVGGEHGCVEVEFADENWATVHEIRWVSEDDEIWRHGFACSWNPDDLKKFVLKRDRDRLERLVDVRLKQDAFRRALIEEYKGRCCVTGFDVLGGLEAAHVKDFQEHGESNVSNGLLLRADIHRMFDRGMLAFEPIEGGARIHLSETIKGLKSKYGYLDGREIELCDEVEDALKEHYDIWVSARSDV